jgi:hypothetical protein
LKTVTQRIAFLETPDCIKSLQGTIGADLFTPYE